MLLHAGRAQRLGELFLHGAVTAHHEPPARVVLAQAREHLGQQEGVLLGVEPTDAEHAQIPVVGTGQGVLARCHVLVVHQRDHYRQNLTPAIATGEIGPDRHERVDPAQRAPHALEQERGDAGCPGGRGWRVRMWLGKSWRTPSTTRLRRRPAAITNATASGCGPSSQTTSTSSSSLQKRRTERAIAPTAFHGPRELGVVGQPHEAHLVRARDSGSGPAPGPADRRA